MRGRGYAPGMNPVGVTGLLVAAIRAEETRRAERLFEDPFADALAGDVGREALAKYRAASPPPAVPVIEVRTRWYDDAVGRALSSGIRQVVVLAAGMDSRAYRLSFPDETRWFEIDQAPVMEHKQRVLADVMPRCVRVGIAWDLAEDFAAPLERAGFDRTERSCWFVEGLLQYLEPAAGGGIFERIDALSPSGSVVLYDVVGRSMLAAPLLASTLKMMSELGAPWIFGSDEPGALLPHWQTNVTEPAIVGNAWKRWPFPAAPPGTPGVPRGYLVEAHKP
jgi:methyltransferase (TIGR00027 family)